MPLFCRQMKQTGLGISYRGKKRKAEKRTGRTKRESSGNFGKRFKKESGKTDEGVLLSPGTMHCGTDGVPFCSEAWDAISRYIYSALQGGAIMHGWTNDDKIMITCCNDGTRPVIFKIERIEIDK